MKYLLNDNGLLLLMAQNPVKELCNNLIQRHLHIVPSPRTESQEMAKKFTLTPVSSQDSYKSREISTSESGSLFIIADN